MVVNVFGSWIVSDFKQGYNSFFMGYKSLNTVVIAGMIFVLAQKWAESIPNALDGEGRLTDQGMGI